MIAIVAITTKKITPLIKNSMNFNHIKYSRGQQIVFVVLACFTVGCFITNWDIKTFNNHKNISFTPDSILIRKIKLFESHIDTFEWHRKDEFLQKIKEIPPTREKFYFNPNTIDSIDILRLGFKPFMAHNWLQYRRHGGKIYNNKKLRSIYGIDSLLVDSLVEFIKFNSNKRTNQDSSTSYIPKKFFVFELNSADTALLSKLPGIGKGRASIITHRRAELGGFYSIEQLCEIENIPDSIIDPIIPYINIELDSIKKININKTSIKRLHRHPYISYYQARAIYNLRWDKKHNGTISDLEELRTLKEFSEEDFEKVKWYLTIEE